jgi:hypothetical protein
MRGSTLFIVFLLICAGAAVSVWRCWLDRWNPWAALDVRDEPNFLTSFKLSRLQSDTAVKGVEVSTRRRMRWI